MTVIMVMMITKIKTVVLVLMVMTIITLMILVIIKVMVGDGEDDSFLIHHRHPCRALSSLSALPTSQSLLDTSCSKDSPATSYITPPPGCL